MNNPMYSILNEEHHASGLVADFEEVKKERDTLMHQLATTESVKPRLMQAESELEAMRQRERGVEQHYAELSATRLAELEVKMANLQEDKELLAKQLMATKSQVPESCEGRRRVPVHSSQCEAWEFGPGLRGGGELWPVALVQRWSSAAHAPYLPLFCFVWLGAIIWGGGGVVTVARAA